MDVGVHIYVILPHVLFDYKLILLYISAANHEVSVSGDEPVKLLKPVLLPGILHLLNFILLLFDLLQRGFFGLLQGLVHCLLCLHLLLLVLLLVLEVFPSVLVC